MEICYNNTYGTVCDDFWDELDAQVVCQQLFNTSLAVPVRGGLYGAGSGDILLDNVVCQGSEESLLQCGSSGLFQHNCAHLEDAGVRCGGIQYPLTAVHWVYACYIVVVMQLAVWMAT